MKNEVLLQTVRERKEVELPEAPVSVHIDGYYKGFHVGITQRDPERQEDTYQLLKNAKALIELMERDGWNPSWNADTNATIKNVPMREKGQELESPPTLCATHNKPMKKRSGKSGQEFFSHARKMNGQWEYCSGTGFPSER